MIRYLATLLALTLPLAHANDLPEKLVLVFEVNPAADGRADACVFVESSDFMTRDVIDFRPSPKFLATACEQFLVIRRNQLRPGDAWSFKKKLEQTLWLKSNPDVPQPLQYGGM
jgi:hypothetical protein